ncbi:hypothetical protein SLA2020_065040 [Shorea laevis]
MFSGSSFCRPPPPIFWRYGLYFFMALSHHRNPIYLFHLQPPILFATGVCRVPDIDTLKKECRIVSLQDNLDFMVFNHRAKVLHSEIDMKLKH